MAQESPLTGLPPELRNEVYGLALISNGGPIDVSSVDHPNEPALLATCKQIRTEALPIFYSENAFRFVRKRPRDSSTSLLSQPSRWLKTLGETRCAFIKDFRIELDPKIEGDKQFSPPKKTMQILQIIKKKAELGNAECQKCVTSAMKTAERDVMAIQGLGVRLSAVQFIAPDRFVSSVDVLKKLFQEACEDALSKHKAMEQV